MACESPGHNVPPRPVAIHKPHVLAPDRCLVTNIIQTVLVRLMLLPVGTVPLMKQDKQIATPHSSRFGLGDQLAELLDPLAHAFEAFRSVKHAEHRVRACRQEYRLFRCHVRARFGR